MHNDAVVVSMNMIKTVFESEHVPTLFDGKKRDVVLRFVAQIVRFEKDSERITEIVRAARPERYAGDSLSGIPKMVAGAIEKGFDEARQEQSNHRGFLMTADGLFVLKRVDKGFIKVPVSAPFEIISLARSEELGMGSPATLERHRRQRPRIHRQRQIAVERRRPCQRRDDRPGIADQQAPASRARALHPRL
jgi:hypothetical protein